MLERIGTSVSQRSAYEIGPPHVTQCCRKDTDGPVEWGQFVCNALACVLGAGVSRKRFKAGHGWQGWLFVGFAFAMFFIAGEEIAWGQRILGLRTSEALNRINDQGEITVHNIVGVLSVFRVGMMLVGALGSLAWLLNRKMRLGRYWDQAEYLMVPPFFLAPAFFVMFTYRLVRYILLPTPTTNITYYGEWAELCLAFGLCAFALLNYRRLAPEAELFRFVRTWLQHPEAP